LADGEAEFGYLGFGGDLLFGAVVRAADDGFAGHCDVEVGH
jgi:hypothetical protein